MILQHDAAWIVDFPECAHGLKDPYSHVPMRKMTRVVTNSECVAHALDRPCRRQQHQRVEGSTYVWSDEKHKYVTMRRSTFSGGYTKQMARTIVRALEAQLMMNASDVHAVSTDSDIKGMLQHQRLQPLAGQHRTWVQECLRATTLDCPNASSGGPQWYMVVRRRTVEAQSGKTVASKVREDLIREGWHENLATPTDIRTVFFYDPTFTSDDWHLGARNPGAPGGLLFAPSGNRRLLLQLAPSGGVLRLWARYFGQSAAFARIGALGCCS